MVDLVVVPANVKSQPNSTVEHGKAGASLIAGQVVTVAADGRYVLADSNAAAPLNSVKGIALHAAATDQPMAVHTDGPINLGVALVAGTAYYLSETPGGIELATDLIALETVVQLGLAASTSILNFRVTAPGVTL